VDDSNLPWFGDLVPDSSAALVTLLIKERIAANIEELFFEAILKV
jgi:hypothetical protein